MRSAALLRWSLWWDRDTDSVISSRSVSSSAPAGYRLPREVIALAVPWYMRYGLSYRSSERRWCSSRGWSAYSTTS